MIVFHFPDEAAAERSAFSVVGQTPSGEAAGELMLVPAGALPGAGFPGHIFYLDERAVETLPICTRTLVPERLAEQFPENPVYISAQLSGGTLRARLEEALARYADRLWLLAEPLSMCFSLPCPSGIGTALSPEEAARVAQEPFCLSQAFCCEYAPVRMEKGYTLCLCDTPRSVREKLRLAEECGVPYVLVLSR